MLIPFNTIYKTYGSAIRGVFHLGAHKAEELAAYNACGVRSFWVEGNPALIPGLKAKVGAANAAHALLWDVNGLKKTFHITNNGQSSSMLAFGTHASSYPGVKFVRDVTLTTKTAEKVIEENKLDTSDYNFANLDLQGVEWHVLKGFGSALDAVDFVYTEVNACHVYKGCDLLLPMAAWLYERGFVLANISMTKKGWGDALFVRKALAKKSYTLDEVRAIQARHALKPKPAAAIPSAKASTLARRRSASSSRRRIQPRAVSRGPARARVRRRP